MDQRQNSRGALRIAGPVLWLVIIGLAIAWRAQNLEAFSTSNDEGAHVMWARLAVDGFRLYSETQAVQAPLFIEMVGLAFRLAGETLQAGRAAILLSFGLLAALLSWLAYQAGGWPGALTALVLLAVSPISFTFSRLVMAEVPATTLAVLAMSLLFVFLDRQQRVWLVASGAVLGLSFLTKALYPFLVVAAALALWLRYRPGAVGSKPGGSLGLVGSVWPRPAQIFAKAKHLLWSDNGRQWRGLLIDGGLWGIGVLFPLGVILFLYEPAALYNQLIAFRADLREAAPGSAPETWRQFRAFFSSHWGFWLLAIGGMASTLLWSDTGQRMGQGSTEEERFRTESACIYSLAWIVWLLAGMVMLWWHSPLFPHHFVVLLPPLILLGAGFGAAVFRLWSDRNGTGKARGRFKPVRWAALLLVAVAALNLPAMVKANRQTAAVVTGGREAEALDLLRTVSAPDDFLMGDSQLLIFMADRRTPPPLGDVALVAIKAGRQTSERMIDLTETYQAPAVVQWSLRLPWLPDYLAWVEENYLASRVWDNDHIIYFGQRLDTSDRPLPNAQVVRLGESITLRGYQVETESLQPGAELGLRVYWQTEAPLDQNYTIFTQLLDSSGALVAGWDSEPLGGYFPTSRWPPHEIITDVVRLPLPADLPSGDYTLVTGMYLLGGMERLPVLTGTDNYIKLRTISIE